VKLKYRKGPGELSEVEMDDDEAIWMDHTVKLLGDQLRLAVALRKESLAEIELRFVLGSGAVLAKRFTREAF